MTKKVKPTIIFDQVVKSFGLQSERKIRNIFNQPKLSDKEVILKKISFVINHGEAIGFYGANGSGKTTILKLIAGIFKPNSGQITVNTKVAAVLELGAGLNPDLTGRENIDLYGAILGLTAQQRLGVSSKIIDFSGLKEKIDWSIRKYSSGMKSRLAFSIVAFSDADVLLLDEVFAVGDKEFLDKSRTLLSQLKKSKTIVISSHNLQLLQRFCDRVIRIKDGQIDHSGQFYQLLFDLPIGESFQAKVTSNSMYPLIKTGDTVTVVRSSLSGIKTGDIVAVYFSNIQEMIVHRVLAQGDEKQLILRGDNNDSPDQWLVNEDSFLGKVVV